MHPICIDNNIDNNIDNKKKSIDEYDNKNNYFLNCFKKKDSKIFPFFEFDDNSIYIRIYHYKSNKFLK